MNVRQLNLLGLSAEIGLSYGKPDLGFTLLFGPFDSEAEREDFDDLLHSIDDAQFGFFANNSISIRTKKIALPSRRRSELISPQYFKSYPTHILLTRARQCL